LSGTESAPKQKSGIALKISSKPTAHKQSSKFMIANQSI